MIEPLAESCLQLEKQVPAKLRRPTSEPKTIVVFRKFKEENGAIIAIFPEENYYAYDSPTKSSYMHVGQHGACDISLLHSETEYPLPIEYQSLADELTSIGYNLDIQQDYQYDE